MNTHDIDIELPPEFQSGNSVPVSQATIKRERMEEILRAAIEADRQSRGEPYAYIHDEIVYYTTESDTLPAHIVREGVAVYTAPQPDDYRQVLEAVKEQFDRFGDSFPDGFDSRVFRWVEDALAAPQLADPVVKDSLTVPDGWQLVPIGLTEGMRGEFRKYLIGPAHHSPDGCYSVFLKAAPTYSATPKRLEDMSKAELIDLIESEREKHQMELEAIGAGEW